MQLTDGLCSSACAYFVELMSHQAGVHTIVAGGTPKSGPMQTAAGSRGASAYTAEALKYDYDWLNDTVKDSEAYAQLPPANVWNETGMWVRQEGLNLRDQLRQNDEVPLQLKYDAAQCRIYYTLDNVYNLTRLWRDAAAATWTDPSLCVRDSTGYATVASSSTKPPPKPTAQASTLDLTLTPSDLDSDLFNSTSTGTELMAGGPGFSETVRCDYSPCRSSAFTCKTLSLSCQTKPKVPPQAKFCVESCTNRQKGCLTTDPMDVKSNVPRQSSTTLDTKTGGYWGYFPPSTLDAVKFNIPCSS